MVESIDLDFNSYPVTDCVALGKLLELPQPVSKVKNEITVYSIYSRHLVIFVQ